MRLSARTALLGLTLLCAVTACASDEGAENTGNDTTAMAADTFTQTPQAMSPARDGQHEFLRGMSDHHEGLVRMAEAAMKRASAPQAQQDAHVLHTKQASERDSMVQKIQQLYQEQHQANPMPKNVAQADSLSKLSGPEYDRTFYRMVADHHREGIQMIDQHMSHLTDPAVKQMAEKMKAEQQREITELERKIGSATGG